MDVAKKKPGTGPDANKIGIPKPVKRRYERIAKRCGWTLVETATRAVDALERALPAEATAVSAGDRN